MRFLLAASLLSFAAVMWLRLSLPLHTAIYAITLITTAAIFDYLRHERLFLYFSRCF